MSEAKPTAGPWRTCGASEGQCVCRGISQENGATIAHWYGNDNSYIEGVTMLCPSVNEGMANAALIVTACNACLSFPDPLAAARGIEALVKAARRVLPLMADPSSAPPNANIEAVEASRDLRAALAPFGEGTR